MKHISEIKSPVTVSQEVFDGINEIRESGVTNMLVRHAVQLCANEIENFELVTWIEDSPKLYARALFDGMVVKS